MDRLGELRDAGVSIWLDTLSRDLLDTGEFSRLVTDCHVTGATSNPTIFAKAITGSDAYDSHLTRLLAAGEGDTRELFFALALDDVRHAADILRPAYEGSDRRDGFVSFECTPDLADDTAATIAQAHDLWNRLQRPNSMIKVPATAAGVPAIETLTADGLNINVTLLFSVDRYRQVLDAYQAGLETRVRRGQAVDHIASVASFFVSRVDTKVDERLPGHSHLRGRAAVANAAAAFSTYQRSIATERWQQLAAAGAHVQRPLWASTGTKNDAYSDVLYVEQLIAPGVTSTRCPKQPSTPSPSTARPASPSTQIRPPTASSTGSPARASTSTGSPPNSSAKASQLFATPTTNSSTASPNGSATSRPQPETSARGPDDRRPQPRQTSRSHRRSGPARRARSPGRYPTAPAGTALPVARKHVPGRRRHRRAEPGERHSPGTTCTPTASHATRDGGGGRRKA
jgi:transaldolase